MRVVRPTPARFDETLALLRAADVAVFGDSDWTADELREEWDGLDLAHDAWLVELDGRIAGVAHLLDRKGGRFIGDGYVHPELTGRGVGGRVLGLLEERALELRPSWPAGERIVLEAAHLVGDERAPHVVRRAGLRARAKLLPHGGRRHGRAAAAGVAGGHQLRPLDPDRDGPMLHDAELEAFADEWGYVPLSYDDWRGRVFGRSGFDPTLVPVVWAGDEVVAFSRNYPKRNGDWGFIANLGVRPAWRRRGLGLALLHESFHRFRETGETTIALGVDVENPTGATRLYEQAGMRVLWQADLWQKELRARD